MKQGLELLKALRGDGQPFLFVDLAVTVASAPDEVGQLLSWVTRASKLPANIPPPPPVADWLLLYRSHRVLQASVIPAMGFSPDLTNADLDELRAIHRVPREQLHQEAAQLTQEEQEDFIRLFVGVPFPPDDATLRAMLADQEARAQSTTDTGGPFEDFWTSAAGQFYFRVWLPCWLLYRELPPRLLRRARLGDLDALDKLLRLDKSVVHDPKIAERVHQLTHTGTKRDRDRILEALKGKPKGRRDAKSLRYGLAGMISQMAAVFQTRVAAPEIAQLFDAIERVRTGNQTDTKIATGETFAKGIQRNRNWPSLPPR